MNLKSTIASLLCALFTISGGAAEPSGYYKTCEGKKGAALLSQLQNVVGDHKAVGYSGLWDLYKTTDVRDDGTIWDMYSTKHWTAGKNQCGSYSVVGDCYNREHSMPKSWFKEASPMYSDAFHIYPTDGKVNGQRSNYPYGECAGGTTLPSNGNVKALGKLGKSTSSGYSGTVFEPDDEYKGDFARSYFYMAAAYNNQIKSWNSDMLANNSYPAFTSWAVEVLLKWHRQDPVSQKELDRNEAVFAAQNNRNPFIDHPEMAEHIWGDRQDEGWNASGTSDPAPALTLPVDGSSLSLGSTIVGVARTAELTVAGSDLTAEVTLTTSGDSFSVSPAKLSKTQANAGTNVTVTFLPSTAGSHHGTLTVACGNLSSTVNLSGEATGTLPAGPVSTIGEDAFLAVWSYVGDEYQGGTYNLSLYTEGTMVDGYPIAVDAMDESYFVENLQPATTYQYTVSSAHLISDPVSVTTLDPIPAVNVLFDGDLHFTAVQGELSEAAELWVEIVNISEDVRLSVPVPFLLSTDKSDWHSDLTLDSEEDRVYLALLSDKPGTFHGSMTITAGDYFNDNVEFIATVTSTNGFYEDFEADAEEMGTYNQKFYTGTGATWSFLNAGIWPGQDMGYDDSQCVRMGKESDSSIEMSGDYAGGFGTLTLYARSWSLADGPATFEVEYSDDGGDSWYSAGEAIASAETFEPFTFTVNAAGPARVRVRQTEGKRFMLDQIEATNFSSLVPDFAADYHSWDAYSQGGKLIIETSREVVATVYALDGTEVFGGRVAPGQLALPLGYGLYIVSVDDFARRVLVK